ncbi:MULTISPECIES: TonB-dependent siderophore receptor [Herbaspirillum]|jgi:iron complex outermembrane receptor protein|uniref:TonB-dependent siderophore receptor n=1 Tax=Herbaspirillum TaxID=963 RepID=UPI0025864717|nr:TonB-dependent siderophore receptor [Herbaspirillum sp.]MCP3655393.1 TonB-dependent siderophore receptor [Herbaspirillum sp.]MCP3947490.1 TonB-dependent siderophore receptor [Herbaspirillum sp.]MCP3947557.1 TonB-dependent siderophore receptor [Herbaspirillum sp.]MCP4033074.1 TonB-dependent siderophore receptor [Herbaspirillum sp.]MCP4556785.1 TonB-dependent siderophore receptor [Herbaspirillum sp.]
MPSLSPGALAVLLAFSVLPASSVLAQTASTDNSAASTQLPTVDVVADGVNDTRFKATQSQVNKSNTPLSQTPQSVSVVTRSMLDSQQAVSLADALENVPGVVAQQYGRRGWDDLIIRGQVASDSLYLDGLRTTASSRVAEQLFGLQQVEVLKGPGSLLYGLVLPGGLVNMVSKRPQGNDFANVDVTVGSHDFYQTTVDMNKSLSENGKQAFRINGLISNSNDATDNVWFKNRYIAPSLSLDLGARTDFTILTSYQERSYVRQQGLPLSGSINSNVNGVLPRSLFIGEPGARPYAANETRVGYALTHRFDDGWTLNNNVRYQQFEMSGQLVANNVLSSTGRSLTRTGTDQTYEGQTFSIDTNVQRSFNTGFGKHEITLGTDYLNSREDTLSYTCTVAALNVYNPVYGARLNCPTTPNTYTSTSIRDTGLYARDNIRFGERWQLLTGLRYDNVSTYSTNLRTGAHTDTPASATTGSAALMYELLRGVRPYISYATSFYPNSGTDVSGGTFKPETGKQWEAGVKFDLDEGRTSLNVAVFDLRRRNVLVSDPNNTGFNIAVGEQRSQGGEISVTSDLRNGLSLNAGYSYTAAIVTDDGGQRSTTVGQWLDNVPRHNFTTSARYRFKGQLAGWEWNGGVHGQSMMRTNGYTLPGYVLADTGVAYNAERWRAALNVKNIFNTHYYAGGLARAVALGDDRTILLTLGYRY